MSKIKYIILIISFICTIFASAADKNENPNKLSPSTKIIKNDMQNNNKKELEDYNINAKKASTASSASYTPCLFLNNSIFSGANDPDDSNNNDENQFYKTKERYYNLIPDNTKDIDAVILLVDGLVAFLSSADIEFYDGYNEFIARLYLIVEFIEQSVSEKYFSTIMLHLSNKVMHNFQVLLYSEDSLLLKDLNIQQKQRIIDALPKKLNYASNSAEYYEYMKNLKFFLQKLIVDFIWITNLGVSSGGEVVVDTDKILENAPSSNITSIQDLKYQINANRSFFKQNKNIQLGILRKDSKKYRNKFLESNIVHQVNLANAEKHEKPVDFLSNIFRKAIDKRLVEQKFKFKNLPESAVDIVNIIAKGFNLQKILLLFKKIKYDNLNKFLVELNHTEIKEINNGTTKKQAIDKDIIFLKIDIKDILKDVILEKIKLGFSRQMLAEIIIEVLGEETNEVIYHIKIFLHNKTVKNKEDSLSIASSSSDYSIKYSDSDYSAFEDNLIKKLESFLYSIYCNQLSHDRIIFFLSLINISSLYLLADETELEYQKFTNKEAVLEYEKKLLAKILANSDDLKQIAALLFNSFSENEKTKVEQYFNDICKV